MLKIFGSNAIQVKNIGRHQVGHLPRDAAKYLARLMDEKKVTVEGVIHDGNCERTCRSQKCVGSLTISCSDWEAIYYFYVSVIHS